MKRVFVMMAVPTVALAAVNDWENLSVNSINREPARTYAMPLASEEAAFSDALEPETPYKVSLNGIWKISWAGNPDLRVKDFYRADFNDADWLTIDVPSCVEMRGFGSPGYVNQRYPHKLEWPFIKDRQSGKADYNPVSSYRRTFTVPQDWKGREVFLRFDGVYSAYYVWVNGQKVGYAEDSKLPSEFNITKCLKDGENLLAVEVYRWCDGSYLEDQDLYRFSGIFRDVTLWSMPKDGIWDFAVKTSLKNDYHDATLEVTGCAGATWTLYDPERREIAAGAQGPVDVPDVNLWSAEKPYLYTLIVKKGSDIRTRKVGFKEVKVSGNTILVNGRKIKFKGVNRHETNPENGRTVSLADMLRDVTLFKRYNINTVRTSHYPNHHLWYDLCDRYGIYVCAEANVEAHEPGYGEKGLGRFPEWEHSISERNLRHVTFYRNHPAVSLWSMGNETGHGICFKNTIAKVKALDPSRPIHWERGNPDADVDSRMYPSVEWLEERGRLGEKAPDSEGLVDKYNRPENRQSPGKPFWMCEYAHAMGNAIGNFAEYWDVFYKYDALTGGCIWDWIDQAVWKYTDRVGADGKRERFLAYGGDWDEQPNDGPFNCNGVIDPQRNVTAKLIEVGHVHRNLVVDNALNLENRFGFTYADEFDGTWELVEDGAVIKSGTFEVPHLAPLSKGKVELPKFETKPGKEYFVNVDFSLKTDTLWAKKGWKVARNQIAFIPQDARPITIVEAQPKFEQGDKTITVIAGGTKAVFCRRSGTLCELVMDGQTILKDPAPGVVAGPQLTCFRAFTDNDIWLRGRELESTGSFYLSGLTQLRYHARPAVIDGNKIRFTVEVTGSKSAGFTHEMEWAFASDGAMTLRNTVTPHGTFPWTLPRLGLSFKLDKALEGIRYYGRGPRENYIDRKTGSFMGLYDSTVTEQFEDYVRPQDNGYKCDVRWAAFTAADGKGVKFSASEPLFLQALHYGAEDLEFARHRNKQQRFRTPLPKREEVMLNLDIRQLGLGGGSCGPAPMDKYIFPVQKETWTLKMEPYARPAAPATAAVCEKTEKGVRLVRNGAVVWNLDIDTPEGKPALHPLTLPSGRTLTDFHPADHFWHLGFWFSFKYLNGVNYWEPTDIKGRGTKAAGETRVTKRRIDCQGAAADVMLDIDYLPRGSNTVELSERRTLSFSAPDAQGGYKIAIEHAFTAWRDVTIERTPPFKDKKGNWQRGYTGWTLRIPKALAEEFDVFGSEGRETPRGICGEEGRFVDFVSRANGEGVKFSVKASPAGSTRYYIWADKRSVNPSPVFLSPITIMAGETLRLAYELDVHGDARMQ